MGVHLFLYSIKLFTLYCYTTHNNQAKLPEGTENSPLKMLHGVPTVVLYLELDEGIFELPLLDPLRHRAGYTDSGVVSYTNIKGFGRISEISLWDMFNIIMLIFERERYIYIFKKIDVEREE